MATILITGATSGLGLSHAIYLTSLGHTVIGTSRNASKIDRQQLKDVFLRDHLKYRFTTPDRTQFASAGSYLSASFQNSLTAWLDKIHFISVDITKMDSVRAGVDQVVSYCATHSCTLDVLINNAGNGYFGAIDDLDMQQILDQFEINYFGQIRMIKAVTPLFRSQGSGLILNTASMAGLISIPFEGHYSASKAAIIRMSESLRMELAPFGIRVVCLILGDINTSFNLHTAQLHGQPSPASSSDLTPLLTGNPLPRASPYYNLSQEPWKRIIQNLLVSPPPLVVSRKIGTILTIKTPKVHYLIGSLTQKLQMWAIRRVASNEFSLDGAASFFGMK